MKKVLLKKIGVTLLEIIVSMVVLSVTLLGFANLYVSSRRWAAHSSARISGGQLGKKFLDPLQMSVRQDTWDSTGIIPTYTYDDNALNITEPNYTYCDNETGHYPYQNSICPPPSERMIDGLEYTARYMISAAPGNSNLRRVTLTLSWTEPTP